MSIRYRQASLDEIEPVAPIGVGVDLTESESREAPSRLERRFDAAFTSRLALREKQVQQSYRPTIGIHKWFARRPGSVFRSLLLGEFADAPIAEAYWQSHCLSGVIADPFMGGGTPIYEANRLGMSVIGADVNPMAYWVVRQSLAPLELRAFRSAALTVVDDVELELADLYRTACSCCGDEATVKYFLWVKVAQCPACMSDNDLFPGYLLADDTRHPRHVVACSHCGDLNEFDRQPTIDHPEPCRTCKAAVAVEGPAKRGKIICRYCSTSFSYQPDVPLAPPRHRMWAIEYHCARCKPHHTGRFFKQPDTADLGRYDRAIALLSEFGDALPIPTETIPAGDETNRLHRWGYQLYRELFNDRQLLGLALLLRRIARVEDVPIREALLTVFSDFLRYQNMLCRYDTYALKCQDIFSVHGYPVGLVQCENNLLGIERVGSGSYRHFVEKYLRAKRYGEAPFETRQVGVRKQIIPISGERIGAVFVDGPPARSGREAQLVATSATAVPLTEASLDGVFTDPPYFDNVQYAELMDFCYVWLRLGLKEDRAEFRKSSTRTMEELTGNQTMGRGLTHFTSGLSAVFTHYAKALKSGSPFVFTYHHNDPKAYRPLIVAILDAGLDCTATLPAAAEMGASLHIAGTNSSVVDSVFVCRKAPVGGRRTGLALVLAEDARALVEGGVKLTLGDLRCLAAGHIAREAINELRLNWRPEVSVADKLNRAEAAVSKIMSKTELKDLIAYVLANRAGPVEGDIHATSV